MYCVYILHSETDDGFYIGFSTDLRRCLKEHQEGKSFATPSIRLLHPHAHGLAPRAFAVRVGGANTEPVIPAGLQLLHQKGLTKGDGEICPLACFEFRAKFNLESAAAHRPFPAQQCFADIVGRRTAKIRGRGRRADVRGRGRRQVQPGGKHFAGLPIGVQRKTNGRVCGAPARGKEKRLAVDQLGLQSRAQRDNMFVAGTGCGGLAAEFFQRHELPPMFHGLCIASRDHPVEHGELFLMFLVSEIEFVPLHDILRSMAQGNIACAGSVPSQNKGFPSQNGGKRDGDGCLLWLYF